ncbi:MAG: response regulator [bacterium]
MSELVKQVANNSIKVSDLYDGGYAKKADGEVVNIASSEDKSSEFKVGSAKRILLVDDEPEPRDAIRQTLELLGYEVLTASNGLEAFQVVSVEHVDLIISDIYMEVVDGLQLLENLRKAGFTIPVILITGYDPASAHQAAEKFGALAILQKPFRLMTLKGVLDKVFGT